MTKEEAQKIERFKATLLRAHLLNAQLAFQDLKKALIVLGDREKLNTIQIALEKCEDFASKHMSK